MVQPRQEGILIIYEYLKGGHTENGHRLFSVVSGDTTSGSEHKLKHFFLLG